VASPRELLWGYVFLAGLRDYRKENIMHSNAKGQTGKPPKRKTVQSVNRALELLEILSSESLGFSLSELSERAGLYPSTTHRLLATLVAKGYVRQVSKTREYHLGFKALELADAALSQIHILQDLTIDLRSISFEIHELVNLAVLDWPYVTYIAQFNGRPEDSVQIFTKLGARVPLYCTAVGKAMLAQLPSEEIEKYFSEAKLQKYTQHTITKQKDLRSELTMIQQSGYAIDNEERAIGVRCVACAIIGINGTPVATVGVSGIASRLPPDRLSTIAQRLIAFADLASRKLGFHDMGLNNPGEVHTNN